MTALIEQSWNLTLFLNLIAYKILDMFYLLLLCI